MTEIIHTPQIDTLDDEGSFSPKVEKSITRTLEIVNASSAANAAKRLFEDEDLSPETEYSPNKLVLTGRAKKLATFTIGAAIATGSIFGLSHLAGEAFDAEIAKQDTISHQMEARYQLIENQEP